MKNYKKSKKQRSWNKNVHIVLITTRVPLEENKRIETEVRNLGYDFTMFDLTEFEYSVVGGKLFVPEFNGLKPDIVIVRGIFNAVKAIATFTKGLRKSGVRVFDNNFINHQYSINKIVDVMKLAQKGLPLPDTFHLHNFDKFLPSAQMIGYPVICKLARTGKGAGVYKFDNDTDLQNFINELQEKEIEPTSYMLQKFVDYKYDLRVLIIGGYLFCMRRVPGVGEFRANFSLGGSVELFELDEAGKKLARKALKAVGLSIGGVDMLITQDNKRYILEVNHTAGFIGMELATSTNIGKIWVEHAIANAK
jgi:RimK family alpha-L-glutamate ligase